MCRSSTEGGQRCAAHTRTKFENAKFGTAKWTLAAVQYASTDEGDARLATLAAEAGARHDYDLEAQYLTVHAPGRALRAANIETAHIVKQRRQKPQMSLGQAFRQTIEKTWLSEHLARLGRV